LWGFGHHAGGGQLLHPIYRRNTTRDARLAGRFERTSGSMRRVQAAIAIILAVALPARAEDAPNGIVPRRTVDVSFSG
jgi:hypothetical protein